MNSIIELNNVSFGYSHHKLAISDISLVINPGEKIALTGSNGAGKSTLLLTLNGMHIPTVGKVYYHNKELEYTKKSLRELRQKVAFVFQDADNQIVAPTVWQDVAFGPTNLEMSEEEVENRVQNALRQVGLEGFDKRPPYHLSGGEKKRVAIAGVLAMDPEILVLDEPTSMLDPAGSESIMDLLDELNNQGKTIIISTHDVELAYQWADRIIMMDNGSIISDGSPDIAFLSHSLVRQAKLKIPLLFDLYSELIDRGLKKTEKLPKSTLDMIHLIEMNQYGSIRLNGDNYGVIHVADVNEITHEGLQDEIQKVSAFGVMGSKAKILVKQWKIVPDFTFGVIDKCILSALNGRSTLILTSGGMVDHVKKRVDSFNSENNQSIPVEKIE